MRILADVGKGIAFVCAVALPAIAAWGLFCIVVYHANLWLVGSFWYLGIGAVAWLLICWLSREPRRTMRDLLLQTVMSFAFGLSFTLVRRVTSHPEPATRDIVFLVFSVILFILPLGIAIYTRKDLLRSDQGSNQSLEPTAGRRDI